MVKCPVGHTLRLTKGKSGKICDCCEEDVEEGSAVHRCAPCDYDCCEACFKKTAVKEAAKTSGGEGVKTDKFDKVSRAKTTASGSSSGPAMHTMSTPKSILKNSPLRVGAMPPVPLLPGMVAPRDPIGAGQNPFLMQDAASGSVGPDEALKVPEGVSDGVPAVLGPTQTPPAPDGVDEPFWKHMGGLLDSKLEPVHSTLVDLQTAVSVLQANAVHKQDFAVLQGTVETIRGGCEQEFVRTNEIADTVQSLSQCSVLRDNRIGKLEKQFSEMDVKNRGPDDSFKRLVFLGLPNCSFEDRCEGMMKFMDSNFPNIKTRDCSVYFRRDKVKNTYDETKTGFVEFASKAVRDRVFDMIDADPQKHQCKIKGKSVDIQKARSRSATDRNKALTAAADLLKDIVDNKGDVKPVWVGSRGVTVRGVYAYEQPSGHDLGRFVGDYEHLELP